MNTFGISSSWKDSPEIGENFEVQKIPARFASVVEIHSWYDQFDGENVVKNCSRAKNFKKAWREYAENFNKENAWKLGFLLQTTVDGIINRFWVSKYNERNFILLVTGTVTDYASLNESGALVVTPEFLCDWYANKGGEEVALRCLNESDFLSAWKREITHYNEQNKLSLGWEIPTTLNGVLEVFRVKTKSIYNLFTCLKGGSSEKLDSQASKSAYLSPEKLREWYKDWGKEMLYRFWEEGSFAKLWREYADNYNKSVFLRRGYQIPNNKVWLVNALGGWQEFTIPEIIRLFEELPIGVVIEDARKKARDILAQEKKNQKIVKKETTPKSTEIKRVTPEKARRRRELQRESSRQEREKRIQEEKKKKEAEKEVRKQVRLAQKESEKQAKLTQEQAEKSHIQEIENQIRLVNKREKRILNPSETQKDDSTTVALNSVVSTSQEVIEASQFILNFQSRFPYFLTLNRKFYSPFRRFVTLLEREIPGLIVNASHFRVKAQGDKLTIFVEPHLLEKYPARVILSIFDEVQNWYIHMMDTNSNIPFLELDIHIDFESYGSDDSSLDFDF